MKFHLKIVIFTIIAVCICCLILPADSEERRHKRRRNHHCNKWKPQPECNEPKCNEGPYDAQILLYPAADWFYDYIWFPEYVPELIQLKKDCCYNLTEPDYYKTTSGVESNGTCFVLYEELGCTGNSLTIPSNVSDDCEYFIDCGELTATDGRKFNDKAASVKLC